MATPDSLGKTENKALKYLVHCDRSLSCELNQFRDVSLKPAVDKAANRCSNGMQSRELVKSINYCHGGMMFVTFGSKKYIG